MSGGLKREVNPHMVEAINHPVRGRVLFVLNDRALGAAEIAEEIGVPVAKVRYHLRALRKAGLIGASGAQPRRGTTEHYFSLQSSEWIDENFYWSLSPDMRRRLTNYYLKLIIGDFSKVVQSGTTHDHRDPWTIRFRMALDEQGWDDVVKIYQAALDQLEAVKYEAQERLEDSGEAPVAVAAALTCLELPPGSAGAIPIDPDGAE